MSAENEVDAIELVNPKAKDVGIIAKIFGSGGTMPTTIAQQIFSIVPGVAGGLAGFFLASKLANTKKVMSKGVWIAAGLNAVLTFATIFLIVESKEIEPGGE